MVRNTYGNVKLLCRQARLVPQIQGTPSATLLSRSNTIVTDAKDQYKKTLYWMHYLNVAIKEHLSNSQNSF